MGDPVSTALIVGAVVSAGTAVYSAQNQPKAPKLPKPPVQIKAPNVAPLADQRAKRLAAGGLQSTILTTPLGLPPASAGLSNKLGG